LIARAATLGRRAKIRREEARRQEVVSIHRRIFPAHFPALHQVSDSLCQKDALVAYFTATPKRLFASEPPLQIQPHIALLLYLEMAADQGAMWNDVIPHQAKWCGVLAHWIQWRRRLRQKQQQGQRQQHQHLQQQQQQQQQQRPCCCLRPHPPHSLRAMVPATCKK
jgi:hypothetical protein